MAMNFKIFHLKNRNSVHLKLDGDFDGTSAFELINAVKKYGDEVDQVFINTNGIKAVSPFGSNVFYNNLSEIKNRSFNLIFIGENKKIITNLWQC